MIRDLIINYWEVLKNFFIPVVFMLIKKYIKYINLLFKIITSPVVS